MLCNFFHFTRDTTSNLFQSVYLGAQLKADLWFYGQVSFRLTILISVKPKIHSSILAFFIGVVY